MEVLILAAGTRLLQYLGIAKTSVDWTNPVEDQNFNLPPKIIVKRVFEEAGMNYSETSDSIEILRKVELGSLVDACPQQFAPFVAFLKAL